MVTAFQHLSEKFVEEFQRHKLNVNTVIRWCTRYCTMYHHEEFDFDVSTMEKLFLRLARLSYCNFLNIRLLQHLADVSKNDCLQASVVNYNNTFDNVKVKETIAGADIKVLDCASRKPQYDTVFVKLIDEGMTYGRLKNFIVAFSHHVLYVQVNSVLPKSYETGCVLIGLLIPSCLTGLAYHAACNSTAVFPQLGIQHLIIGTYRIKPPAVPVRGIKYMYVYAYMCLCNILAKNSQTVKTGVALQIYKF